MIERHQEEMKDLMIHLEQTTTLKFKPSPELLNLRKIQATLAKQKK